MEAASPGYTDLATGVCNCCLNEGHVHSLMEPTSSGGIYAEQLMVCYGLDVMAIDIGDRKRVICSACVRRLSEALQFRCRVEQSLRAMSMVTLAPEEVEQQPSCTYQESNNTEDVNYGFDENERKTELLESLADCNSLEKFDCHFEDSEFSEVAVKTEENFSEDEPLKQKKTKITKESSTSLSKSLQPKISIKLKKRKTVRAPTTEQVKTFLKAGLFPFRGAYQCVICKKKFEQLSKIRTHMSDHEESAVIGAVKKWYRSPPDARFVVRSSKLLCKFCSQLIKSYPHLERHVEDCRDDKRENGTWREKLPFQLEKDQVDCPICKERFLSFVTLNTHMNVHYPNYICESCGKAFASQPRLKGHMRIHEFGEFPCKFCEMVFDKVTKRENHISRQHKAGVRYSCPHCTITFTSFYARQKHLAEEHDQELKRYKCKMCPQRYITPGHLSNHVRRDHLNERNHRCDKCPCAFFTKHSLTMHMITHDGERIHSCPICSKSYQRAKTLKEHMRIHNNDKRFVCPTCGRAFTQKCTLKSHLKVHERRPNGEEAAESLYGRQRHSI